MSENGKAKVSVFVREKIGLPNYSNVELSFGMERDVPDETRNDAIRELASEVESVLEEERSKVLEFVKASSKA